MGIGARAGTWQLCVEEKTNEITTVPLLLELLDISGCIVTADAMNCQRKITKKIIEGYGDYVRSLQENRPRYMSTRAPISRMPWRIKSGIRR